MAKVRAPHRARARSAWGQTNKEPQRGRSLRPRRIFEPVDLVLRVAERRQPLRAAAQAGCEGGRDHRAARQRSVGETPRSTPPARRATGPGGVPNPSGRKLHRAPLLDRYPKSAGSVVLLITYFSVSRTNLGCARAHQTVESDATDVGSVRRKLSDQPPGGPCSTDGDHRSERHRVGTVVSGKRSQCLRKPSPPSTYMERFTTSIPLGSTVVYSTRHF